MGNGVPGGSRAGTEFGPYDIRRLLGKGGMGEVYEAYDREKGRTVALKLLPGQFGHDAVYQERFRRESRTAARLQEPHVIPIHDWGEIDGVLFIDMRMVNGQDLRSLLKDTGPLAPARAVDIIAQIASALDAAHADGLVHRDVKPENILVTPDDFAYLVDFGIAHSTSDTHLTEMGSAVGSYRYMAPERFDDQPVTKQADVYSLACVLYECLTGSAPFNATTVNRLIMSHLAAPPPRPSLVRSDIPEALDAVVAQGLAKSPADRFRTTGALANAARSAVKGPGRPKPPRVAPDAGTQRTPGVQRSTAPPTVPRIPMPPQPQPRPAPQPAQPFLQPATPQHWGPPTPPQRQRKSSMLGPILIIAAILVLLLMGVIWWLTSRDSSGTSLGPTTTRNADSASTYSTIGASSVPPPTSATIKLPAGAQPCEATTGAAGQFRNSARGTSVTSCPFAEETRQVYGQTGTPSTTPRQIQVYSPVTGDTYAMTCLVTGDGPLVTCTGGTDAIVYLY